MTKTMNDIIQARAMFEVTVLKQVKLKLTKLELEMIVESLKYLVLGCNVCNLNDKLIAFNAYKLIQRLQPRLFTIQKKQCTVTLNISECDSVKRAYIFHPGSVIMLARVYMTIDSQIC